MSSMRIKNSICDGEYNDPIHLLKHRQRDKAKTMSKPYLGKILRVDLSTHQCFEESIDDEVYARYLSGVGLAAFWLYTHIPASTDPLGPDNVLGFVSGMLTGTPSSYTGRWLVAAKSPLTGTWGEANCGGYFSIAIKQCRYDGIFFSGTSPKPVYLYVGSGEPEIRDAAHLWGLDTVETEDALSKTHQGKKRIAVASIGQAGENLSLISGICHDGGRMAARSGLGAVMGSKNLKAVVLQRSGKVGVVDRQGMRDLNAQTRKHARIQLPIPGWVMPIFGKLLRNPWLTMRMDGLLTNSVLKKWGSAGFFQTFVEWDDAPIKNWLGSHQDYPERKSRAFSADRIQDAEKGKYHCYACPTGCGGKFMMPGTEMETHKPEYETINAFGALLLMDDFDSVVEINDLLNRAGMDSISAGATIAAAIEWVEAGLISDDQTGRLDLRWGNAQSVQTLVGQMICREGFGAYLADGVVAAKAALGIKRSDAAVHAGGQELAMHDSRLDAGYALHASVEPNPGRHTTGAFLYYDLHRLWKVIPELPRIPWLSFKRRGRAFDHRDGIRAAANACFINFYNGLGVCYYGAHLGVDRLALFDMVNAACGWERTPREYMQIGQRILTLKQLFNIKQGIDPATIKPSRRALGQPPLQRGGNRGVSIDLESLRKFYWSMIGFDATSGIPTRELLEELNLVSLADELNLPALVVEGDAIEQGQGIDPDKQPAS